MPFPVSRVEAAVTDFFIENDLERETRPGALAQLRAEVARTASQLEHRVHDSASGVMEDARFLVRRTQHKINSRLGVSALIALGVGLVLGLAAAALSQDRARRRAR